MLLYFIIYCKTLFLFARTLFSRRFARAERRENKILANNSLYKDYKEDMANRETKVS